MTDSIISWSSTVLVPIILVFLKQYFKRSDEKLEDIYKTLNEIKILAQKTADGTKTITRYRLFQDMTEIIHKGSISVKQLEDITLLIKSYEDLVGNSTVTELYNTCKSLPKTME